MGEKKAGNTLLGLVIGVVLGVFLAEHRVATIAAENGEVAPIGYNPIPYMGHVRFWIVLVICTLVFTFMVGKIGRKSGEADM